MITKLKLFSKKISPRVAPILLLGLALIARLVWLAYTNFTEEDAFIVFRFARNLAGGLGFVFNPGDRVYGSTTPLYTFLLSLWYRFTGMDFNLSARLFCLGAGIASLALLWIVLRRMQVPLTWRVALLVLLGLSTKTILMDTQGLETPFVILFMMASWYMFITGKPGWAGLFAGLLLWVRIDTFLWPVALAIAASLTDFRRGIKLLGITGLIYLPWVIFAWWYFGSPVPLTVLAKWTATGMVNIPLQEHLQVMIGYLSPLDFGPFGVSSKKMVPALIAGFFTLIFAAWHGIFSIRRQWLLAPSVFILLELVRLGDTRAAIDNRYFYPMLWCVWILFLLGAFSLWEKVQQRGSLSVWIPRTIVVIAAAAVLLQGVKVAGIAGEFQKDRNESSLKEVGLWLKNNSPSDATVLLEPLGYIGYYSGRRLLDDAGLVTPKAVALRLQGVTRNDYYKYFNADYVVMHCGFPENLRNTAGAEEDFLSKYRLITRIDPLQYNPEIPSRLQKSVLPWSSCYEIWQRQ